MKVSELGLLAWGSNPAWGQARFQQSILLVWPVVAYSNLILTTRHLRFSNTDTLTSILKGYTL